MVANAINALKQRRAEINSQIRTLEKEGKSIDRALAALGNAPEKPVVAEAATAAVPAKGKKRRKMSKLGQLKIKLGSLNRYGKKDEAKKIQEQIDALLDKK